MSVPTRAEAEALVEEASQLSPGRWPDHVRNAALAAEAIAQAHPDLDPERAYVMGLLHDIGRRVPNTSMRHVIDGYTYMMELGYDDCARICLTHSFPLQNVHAHAGEWDCTSAELEFVTQWLADVEYTDYDNLIQLCDGLALPDGCCQLEVRLVDVARRHGINNLTLPRWEATFAIKRHFEAIIAQSIYDLLPNLIIR